MTEHLLTCLYYHISYPNSSFFKNRNCFIFPVVAFVSFFICHLHEDIYMSSMSKICKGVSFWLEWRQRVITGLLLQKVTTVTLQLSPFTYTHLSCLWHLSRIWGPCHNRYCKHHFSTTQPRIGKETKRTLEHSNEMCQISGTSVPTLPSC